MIVIAPLFGIAQMVYFLGVAETLLGHKSEKKQKNRCDSYGLDVVEKKLQSDKVTIKFTKVKLIEKGVYYFVAVL